MLHSDSTVELTKALVAVQKKTLAVTADKTVRVDMKGGGNYSYHYADLTDIWTLCRESLTDNGLAISQVLHITDQGYQSLVTLLLHESGEWISSEIKVEPSQANNPQALGSAITYARRYALTAIVGITVVDEDDDGHAGSQQQTRSQQGDERPAQATAKEGAVLMTVVEFLNRAMKTFGYKSKEAICTALGVEKPVDILEKYETFDKAGAHLESLHEEPPY